MLGLSLYLAVDTAVDGQFLLAAGYGVVGLAVTWWLSPCRAGCGGCGTPTS